MRLLRGGRRSVRLPERAPARPPPFGLNHDPITLAKRRYQVGKSAMEQSGACSIAGPVHNQASDELAIRYWRLLSSHESPRAPLSTPASGVDEHPCDALCFTAFVNLHVQGGIVRLVSASRKWHGVFLAVPCSTVSLLAAVQRKELK